MTLSKGEQTKLAILEAGAKMWPDVTTREIGRQLDMTHANVAYHFKSRQKLLKAIIAYALEMGNSRVIAHLILTKNPAVKNMSPAERAKHMRAVS